LRWKRISICSRHRKQPSSPLPAPQPFPADAGTASRHITGW
jgi:hypothetical protein